MGEQHGYYYISYFDSDYPCSVYNQWCKSEKELKRHINIYHGKIVKLCHFECNFCDENVGTKDKFLKS